MNSRNSFFCIVLLFLLPLVGLGIVRQQDESKRELISVKGRIIGYSLTSQMRFVYGQTSSLPHDAFLFLVEQGGADLKAGEFIKLQYRATPKHQENLPGVLFEESSQRTFIVERDKTCDESTESFIQGGKPVGKERHIKGTKRLPNLIRLRGAENILLPKKGTLRCYSFDWDGMEK